MPSVETSPRDTNKNPGITVQEKRRGLGSGVVQGGEARQGEEGEQTGEEEERRGAEEGERKEAWRGGESSPCRLHQGQQTQHSRPHEGNASISFKMRGGGK